MMTVMLIRRHCRAPSAVASPTTLNYPLASAPHTGVGAVTASPVNAAPSGSRSHSHIGYSKQSQFAIHPLKFRMTYSSPARAMRYYRVWIYTCNIVLFVCVIGFIIVACKVIVADPRRTLIPEFTMTHPSIYYVYFAVIMQSGILQVIGCLGAKNLNERLLNVYWYLLLVLFIGDVLLGLFWVHHFEYIVEQMRPVLKQRFRSQYAKDSEFTELWDMVQRLDQCCGVENYKDYYQNNNTLLNFITTPSTFSETSTVHAATMNLLPASCCGLSLKTTATTTLKPPEARRQQLLTASTTSSTTLPPLPPLFATAETISVTEKIVTDGITSQCSVGNEVFYTTGCEKRLVTWLKSSLDVLFVIGYCVISFLKLCFLGILRYEIREMIQKIRILRTEQKNNSTENQDTGMTKLQQIRRYDLNGSIIGVTQPLLEPSRNSDRESMFSMDEHEGDNANPQSNERRHHSYHHLHIHHPDIEICESSATTPPGNGEPESTATRPCTSHQAITVATAASNHRSKSHENLGGTERARGGSSGSGYQSSPMHHLNCSPTTMMHNRQRHFSLLNDMGGSGGGGNDSDTNSHCALIVPDAEFAKTTAKCRYLRASSTSTTQDTSMSNYEMHELQDLDRSKHSRCRNKI